MTLLLKLNQKILSLPLCNINKKVFRNASMKPKKQKQPFLILRATRNDYTDILRLMKKAYYREEPTASSIGFRSNLVSESHCLRAMSEGFTLVAKCKYTGNIVGACINQSTNPWDPDLKDRLACLMKCPKTKRLLQFEAHLQRQGNLWKTYNIMKIYEISYLFVRRDERGKGLASKLMEHSRNLAADCRFTLVRVDATNFYTAKICDKMKMKLICEIPYASYVDKEEEPVFKPLPPHNSVKIYIDDNLYEPSKK